MKGKLFGFAVALMAIATIGVVQLQTKALDSSPDCDQFAVIWCGTYSMDAVRNAYDSGHKNSPNIAKIFNAVGVSRAELKGSAVDGVVYKNGDVKVGNKLVATGARTAMRNVSFGNQIPGTNASVVSTSQMADAQTALVKLDGEGNFLYAVMKPCGNPVKATPVPPKPQPKPTAECKNLAVEKIDRTKRSYTAKAAVTDGATVSGYTFVTKLNGTIVKTDTVTKTGMQASSNFTATEPGDYKVRVTVATSEGEKSGPDCVKEFTVKDEKTPAARCDNLTVTPIENNLKLRFDAKASVENGATVSKYTFTVLKAGVIVDTIPVATTTLQASTDYSQTTPGDYTVRATVSTSAGEATGPECEKPFTVTPPPVNEEPGVTITKLVNGEKSIRIGVGVEYDYQITVKNTGNTDLKNVVVTDKPEAGVTLLSSGGSIGTITNNTWTYTIPELVQGATMNFTLRAKVPAYQANAIKNTACVDAPGVPGSPDECDDATVVVPPPKPGKVEVCNPETGEIITVEESEADKYVPVDSPKCKTITVCVLETKQVETIRQSDYDTTKHTTDLSLCTVIPVPETPGELPTTGPVDTAVQVVGATSLAGALGYYLTSRRQRM